MPTWFRFYNETIDDRKLKRIARETEQAFPTILGCWSILLSLANNDRKHGRLLFNAVLPMGRDDLVHEIGNGLPESAASRILFEFEEMGLIAVDAEAGAYYVADWQRYVAPEGRRLSSAWQRVRQQVLTRDGYRCRYCGMPAQHVDHVIPRSLGGTHDPENLVAACAACNCSKGARTPEQAGMEVLHG